MVTSSPAKIATGIEGLDRILYGGLPAARACLVYGGAGAGKTTLALQFLNEGLRRGERCLYLTLLQSEAELDDVVASHGWDLDGLDVVHLPSHLWEEETGGQTLFSSYDVELTEITDAIADAIARHRPQRLVVDSVGELNLLVENNMQLRRTLLRLKLVIADSGATAIVTAGESTVEMVFALQTIFNGVVQLTSEAVTLGRARRRLEVMKQRGAPFLEGRHDLRIVTGGLAIFPRLAFDRLTGEPAGGRTISSDIAELDRLTGGGLEEGTACLITGTTGAGKSTVASLYATAAARRGERAAVYCFDERRATYMQRSGKLGLPVRSQLEAGQLELREMAVGEMAPGEFVDDVRRAVAERDVKVVVIDSVTGFLHASDGTRETLVQLHELLSFLGAAGVLTLMIVTDHGLVPGQGVIDASYLADTVLLLRHFEAHGTMHRCIAVTKKRHGPHERTIRQLETKAGGVEVGPPLSRFRGVLSGIPDYHGDEASLIHDDTTADDDAS